MLSVGQLDQVRCRHCGGELVVLRWGTVVSASCTNPRCRGYKQPQKEREEGKMAKDAKQKRAKKGKSGSASLRKGAKVQTSKK